MYSAFWKEKKKQQNQNLPPLDTYPFKEALDLSNNKALVCGTP